MEEEFAYIINAVLVLQNPQGVVSMIGDGINAFSPSPYPFRLLQYVRHRLRLCYLSLLAAVGK